MELAHAAADVRAGARAADDLRVRGLSRRDVEQAAKLSLGPHEVSKRVLVEPF
jgi:hypothetical protein